MWTNDIPAKHGFYWYRESLTLPPHVIELNEDGRWTQTDYEGDMFYDRPAGLFWSERLEPPK